MSNRNNIVPVRARGLGLDQQQHLCFQGLTSILIVQSIKCFVANPPKLVVTHCIGMSQYISGYKGRVTFLSALCFSMELERRT